MAKLRKRKRRKFRFTTVCAFILLGACVASLFFSVFFRTINDQLTMDIQNMNAEISLLKGENKEINIEIQSLENKDRVYVVAEMAGLDQNQENIISIGE